MLEAAFVSQLNVQLNNAATIVGRGAWRCGRPCFVPHSRFPSGRVASEHETDATRAKKTRRNAFCGVGIQRHPERAAPRSATRARVERPGREQCALTTAILSASKEQADRNFQRWSGGWFSYERRCSQGRIWRVSKIWRVEEGRQAAS